MNEPINPYESPVTPLEPKSAGAEPLGVIANFEVDDRVQWHSAALNNQPLPVWLTIVVLLLVLVAAFFAIALYVQYGPFGPILFFALGFAILQGGTYWLGRRQTIRNLEILRQHPVLGAKGAWRLKVGHHEVTVETPGGTQQYELSQVPFLALEGHDLILWLEPGYPLVVPDGGKYKRMNWLLRKWLLKVTPVG